MYFIHLHCVLFYCNGGCGLSVLCNKEYDDDDDGIKRSINLAIVEILSLSVALTMGNSTFNT